MVAHIITICMGARAAKGEGLKILWHRPSRVRIPSHALFIFLTLIFRLSGSGGKALPW